MSPRVLVVDDDADIRDSIVEALISRGYRAWSAAEGAAALAVMREAIPRLVLLDLMMPGFDGWRVLYEMERDPALRAIPVCVVSAYAERAPPGVACVLAKPVALPILFATVERYCGPAG